MSESNQSILNKGPETIIFVPYGMTILCLFEQRISV